MAGTCAACARDSIKTAICMQCYAQGADALQKVCAIADTLAICVQLANEGLRSIALGGIDIETAISRAHQTMLDVNTKLRESQERQS